MFEHPLLTRLNDRIAVEGECWIWTASKDTSGYGHVRIETVLYKVHRFVFETLNGPANGHIHHTCHVRACCRPTHLAPVDPVEHGKMHGGHVPEPIRICPKHGVEKVRYGEGRRNARLRCRECRREQQALRRASKQAPSQDESAVHAPKPSGILTENAG